MRKIFEDKRSQELSGISNVDYGTIRDEKLNKLIATYIYEEHQSLLSKPDISYADSVIQGLQVERPDLSVFNWDNIVRNRKNAPFCYVQTVALRSLRSRTALKRGGRTPDDWSSNQQDWAHLIGAGYCDLFSCHKNIAQDLRNARQDLGFSDSLVGPPGSILNAILDSI